MDLLKIVALCIFCGCIPSGIKGEEMHSLDNELVMDSKESYLKDLDALPLADLWDLFLNVQGNLFFSKEFGHIFEESWWKDAYSVLQIGSQNGQLLAKLANEFPEKNMLVLIKSLILSAFHKKDIKQKPLYFLKEISKFSTKNF